MTFQKEIQKEVCVIAKVDDKIKIVSKGIALHNGYKFCFEGSSDECSEKLAKAVNEIKNELFP